MSRIWRITRKVLMWSAITIGGLLLLIVIATIVFEKDLKRAAVKELNKYLQTEVKINPYNDIYLSFFSDFPNASLTFENFKIRESIPGSRRYIAEVKLLSLQFSPLDLLKGKYNLQKLLLKDAVITIRTDEMGRENYHIWKSTPAAREADTAASPLEINLSRIVLLRVLLNYEHAPDSHKTATFVEGAAFKGRFTDKVFELETQAELQSRQLSFSGVDYLKEKHVHINSRVKIDNENKVYSIIGTELGIGKAAFTISGQASQLPDATALDFEINSKDNGIQTIFSLLPPSAAQYLKDYKSSGLISLNAKIKGRLNELENPYTELDFQVKDAVVKMEGKPLALQGVNMHGRYDNGKQHQLRSSSVDIKDFQAKLNGREVKGSFSMKNFEDPVLDVALMADVELGDVARFAELKNMDTMKGHVVLDAAFKGRVSDLKEYRTMGKTNLSGKMLLKDVKIVPHGEQLTYNDLNGEFFSDGRNLKVRDFTGRISHSDFKLNGVFKNLSSFLFLPNEQLVASAVLESNYINLDDFLSSEETSQGTSTAETDTSYHVAFPAFMVFDFRLHTKKLVYGKFEAEDVKGNINLEKDRMELKDVSGRTMKGFVSLNGLVENAGGHKFRTTAKARMENISVSSFFYELNNFGQEFFTEKHINGRMNATVEYSSLWYDNMSPDLNSIAARADITIDNGQIVNFQPLIDMGNFLKVKSLDNLQFSRLQNTVTISQQKIYIPRMDVKSSAMNMEVAGVHTFDNVMDYKLRLNISQLLFGKKREYENEFGVVETDERGGMNLFLVMKGPGDDPEIKYDAASSGKNFIKGLKQEGQSIKQLFTGETQDTKPNEDLNNSSDDYQLDWSDDGEEEAYKNTDSRSGKEQPETPSRRQQERRKAFQDLKSNIFDKEDK